MHPEQPSCILIKATSGLAWGRPFTARNPYIRAVLDQCDQWLRAERDTSLLDVMFGRSGAGDGDLNDPAWAQPAIYALEVALTALWESVGIRPDTVLGQGIGEVAAAQVSGALVREDGMRLAASLTGPDVALYRNTPAPPERTWVSSVTGRVVPPSEVRDNAYW